MEDSIQLGIKAYQSGDREIARKLLINAIKQFPDDERSWGWLYNVCETDRECFLCLIQVLRINPKNDKANKLIKRRYSSWAHLLQTTENYRAAENNIKPGAKPTWVLNSFNRPDLIYANQYYTEHVFDFDKGYQPRPAMINCGPIEKPAIFVKVDQALVYAVGRKAIFSQLDVYAVKLKQYVVLRIRHVLEDPEGNPLSNITITTSRSKIKPSQVVLDILLDIEDIETYRWLNAWINWPSQAYFFMVPNHSKVSGFLHTSKLSVESKKVIIRELDKAIEMLKEIPEEARSFSDAVSQIQNA